MINTDTPVLEHVLKNSGPRNTHGMNYVRICRNSINFLSPKRMFSSGLASPGIACAKSTNRIASSSLGEIGWETSPS